MDISEKWDRKHLEILLSGALITLEDTRNGCHKTRADALRLFHSMLESIRSAVAAEFPHLSTKGVPLPEVARRVLCPACSLPMLNFRVLAEHAERTHGLCWHVGQAAPGRKHSGVNSGPRCWCGAQFKKVGHLARHLAAQANLEAHCIVCALGEQQKKEAGDERRTVSF